MRGVTIKFYWQHLFGVASVCGCSVACGSAVGLLRLKALCPSGTSRAADIAIFEYISGFYNPRRRNSALGWKSPLAFERKAA